MILLTDFRIHHSQLSDRGLVREKNEDFAGFSTFKKSRLFVVADGLGGCPRGEVASKEAVTLLLGLFEREEDKKISSGWFLDAFDHVNRILADSNKPFAASQKMGTTLTAAYFHGEKYWTFHVGDSRFYRFRDGVLDLVTTDHSMGRNCLTQAIGLTTPLETEFREGSALPGDRYLLCTDGLYSMLDDDGIREGLSVADPRRSAERLVALAIERGGEDNVTVQVVDIRESER